MRRIVAFMLLAACTVGTAAVSGWTPISHAQTASAPAGDEFNSSGFGTPFIVQCGRAATQPCPDDQGSGTWSLDNASAGNLRIVTQPGTLVGSTNNARNIVLQPKQSASDYTLTTSVKFPASDTTATTPVGQTAGLIVYGDDDHFIYLGRKMALNGTQQIEFFQEEGTTDLVNDVTETSPAATVYLRLVNNHDVFEASYSYDNVTFTPIAPGGESAPTATAVPTDIPAATATAEPTNSPPPPPGGTSTPEATATASETPAVTATETATAVATATETATPAATATATETATDVPTATTTTAATDTPTTVPTDTPTTAPTDTPTATATTGAAFTSQAQTATGYSASFLSSQVGVFAWGGTDTLAAENKVAADFDWLRVGDSTTPAPTATAAAPSGGVTKTTNKAGTLKFSYTSVWYHSVKIGTKQHIQVQSAIHKVQRLWVTVRFATGKTLRFFTNTNSSGFWSKNFKVPANTIAKKSARATVTFQLWKGNKSIKRYAYFTVIRKY